MAITTIGGNINSTAVLANLDYKYGPYNSLQEAYDTLGPNGVDKLAIGLTVGIIEDGRIREYWFKSGTDSVNNLVLKSEGKSAYDIAVEEGFEGTEQEWIDSLKGEKGDNAINPFKGWYDSDSNLPENPVVGDYAYIKGASSTDPAAIYECTDDGTWSDSGRTADTSNVQTFASNQEVNEVHIVNDLTTGGVSDVLSAEQGKLLKQQIDEKGITLDITKSANIHNSAPATVSETQPTDGSDWAAHYINTGGNIAASANYNSSYFIEVVSGASYKSNITLRSIHFYNENKEYLAGTFRENVLANSEIVIPDNAVYTRFSYYVSNGNPLPNYVKFGKYGDDINVDYVYIVRDFDSEGNEIFLKKDINDIVVDTEQIENNAVTNEKIEDNTIENNKLKYPLPVIVSRNLFDKDTMIDGGRYINNDGNIASSSNWSCTDYIEIESSTDYYFYAKSWGRSTGYVWYDENKQSISPSSTATQTIAGIHTSPSTAKYVRFNLKSSGVDSEDVMLAKSSMAIPYEEYGIVSLPTSAIKDFSKEVNETVGLVKKLNAVKNGNYLTVSCGNDTVDFVIEKNLENIHGSNSVVNITGRVINGVSNPASDDIAPMHVLNTTLGANHAQPIQKVTITSHGLTNQDVGTEWVRSSDSKKFYIVRIVDADNVWILSENTRSYTDPIRVKLSQGDVLTKDGISSTAESVVDTQMYPGLKNHIVSIYCDDNIIANDGNYTCNKISIVEQYDIMNPESVLQNLITNVGNSDEPIYDGDSAVRVENVYTFDSSITMTVLTTVVFLEAVRFGDIMLTQLTKAASKYYVPNSLPIASGIDLRTPSVVSWTSSTPLCNITQDKVDNTEHPINRVLQYGDNVGYAIGYLQDIGVAQKINNYTSVYFEIRNNSGKIYPHPVDYAKTLTYQKVGNIYTALMYVAPFVPEESGSERLSAYTVKNGDSVYVYVDYIDSILDKVVVDNSLNEKKITVLESSNAELVSMDNSLDDETTNNIYNNGFYVNANYVDGETCYIVLKIG